MFVDTYHSRVGFAPGTLSVCDQPVQYIEWDTTCRQSANDVWEKVTDLQKSASPLHIKQDAFCDLFMGVKNLLLTRLVICTDVTTLEIQPYNRQHIIVKLPDQQILECRATPPFEASVSETVQVLQTALYFLGCPDLERAETKLAKMELIGAGTEWEP